MNELSHPHVQCLSEFHYTLWSFNKTNTIATSNNGTYNNWCLNSMLFGCNQADLCNREIRNDYNGNYVFFFTDLIELSPRLHVTNTREYRKCTPKFLLWNMLTPIHCVFDMSCLKKINDFRLDAASKWVWNNENLEKSLFTLIFERTFYTYSICCLNFDIFFVQCFYLLTIL